VLLIIVKRKYLWRKEYNWAYLPSSENIYGENDITGVVYLPSEKNIYEDKNNITGVAHLPPSENIYGENNITGMVYLPPGENMLERIT
jgi:hypothetical protein